VFVEIRIETAVAADLPGILAVLNQYHMGHFGHEEREAMPPLENFVVARDGDAIVGCAAFLLHGQGGLARHAAEAETGSLAVLPAYRGRGLGALLQRVRLRRLAGMGIQTLYTEADAPATVEWYVRKFGYRILSTRKKRFPFGAPGMDTFTLLRLDLAAWARRNPPP
jgi:N-acetylglutamate synthase-like GNAT family acetyltransferase